MMQEGVVVLLLDRAPDVLSNVRRQKNFENPSGWLCLLYVSIALVSNNPDMLIKSFFPEIFWTYMAMKYSPLWAQVK